MDTGDDRELEKDIIDDGVDWNFFLFHAIRL